MNINCLQNYINNIISCFLTSIVLIIVFLSVSCKSSTGNKYLNRKVILEQFQDERGTEISSKKMESSYQNIIKNIHIFIDGSVSQIGFADINANLNENYNKVINAVIDKSIVGWSGCSSQIYKFGSAVFPTPITEPIQLHKKSFYNQPQTDLASVIEVFQRSIEKNKSLKSSIAIIITDGVQSVSTERGTLGRLNKAINKWIESENLFGVMMYKSNFNGPMFSETTQQIINQTFKGMRPFYLLVLSPDLANFERLYLLLSGSNLKPEASLLFKNFKNKNITWVPKSQKKERNALVLHHSDLNQKPEFYWIQESKGTVRKISFNIELEENKFWNNEPFRIDVLPFEIKLVGQRYHRMLSKHNWEDIIKTDYDIDSTKIEGNKIYFSLRFNSFSRNLQPGSVDIFRVIIRPYIDGLKLPDWVKSVSTIEDVKLENYSKTYNFENFIKNILSNYIVTGRMDIADFYICIQRS